MTPTIENAERLVGVRKCKKCPDCNGRGWHALDMMGTDFEACKTCKTHLTKRSPTGHLYTVKKRGR